MGCTRMTRGGAGAAAILGFVLALGLAAPASAQDAGGALGGFRTAPGEPIEVEADSLEVQDSKHTATFIGNVRVVQGDIRMKSDRLVVYYKGGGQEGSSRIEKIAATGNVLISSPDEQTASGDWANYLVATRQIEMGNSVVLRQGENVIRGSTLQVDLDTGHAKVSGGGSGKNGGNGRVKGLFQPPSD